MFPIENINFATAQQIHLSTTWSGQNLSSEFAWLPDDTKFFVLPFIFANFLNEYSIRKDHVLRFWFGWQFLTPDLSLKRSELIKKMRELQIKLLLIINDKLNDKNCIIKRNLSTDKLILLNNFGKYLADFEYTDKLNSIYHLNVLWKNPFLIPKTCLNSTSAKLNNVKISWISSQKNTKFPQTTSKIKIEFRWPITTPLIRYQLNSKKALRFKIPFFYWLRFRLSKPTLIEPILHNELTFTSDLKQNYQFQNPFEGLFHFEFSPLHWSIEFEKVLLSAPQKLREFFHELIKNFRFNSNINQPQARTKVFSNQRLQSQFNSLFQFQTKIYNHEKFLMNDRSFVSLFYHFLQNNPKKITEFPIILNKIDQQALFLTKLKTPDLMLHLRTIFQFPIFFDFQFLLLQNVQFRNHWINQIKIKPDHIISKKLITTRYFLTLTDLHQIWNYKFWKELKIENNRI